jgi:hypothetical protein
VSYRGRWHDAGRAFDIDPADAEEMKKHGEVTGEPVQEPVQEPKPAASRKKTTKQ